MPLTLAGGPEPPAGLAGLDHLPSLIFNAVGGMGLCYRMWEPHGCGGNPHFCRYYRAFPHVCQCARPGHGTRSVPAVT
mgnify:CR=1 FL=1